MNTINSIVTRVYGYAWERPGENERFLADLRGEAESKALAALSSACYEYLRLHALGELRSQRVVLSAEPETDSTRQALENLSAAIDALENSAPLECPNWLLNFLVSALRLDMMK